MMVGFNEDTTYAYNILLEAKAAKEKQNKEAAEE